MTTLAVVIVTYNCAEFIPELFATLAAQTRQPDDIIVVDNASTDHTVELVRQVCPTAKLFPQLKNLDFSAGVNLGIQSTHSNLVLLLNPDLTLAPDAIEQLMIVLLRDEHCGAVAPKLQRLSLGIVPTSTDVPVLDSMGIVGSRRRQFTNLGEGQTDHGQYDLQVPFGLAGTALLVRRSALDDIAEHGGGGEHEYLDEDFVAYKDDIDLSYRLRHRGWGLLVVPKAIMQHHRTARELTDQSAVVATAYRQRSVRIKRYSLRNQWWVLLKNEPWQNLLLDLPWILWYEMMKLTFIVVFDPRVSFGIADYLKGLSRMLKKRQAILSSSVISAKTLRAWFIHS